jgi:hypothetical protein
MAGKLLQQHTPRLAEHRTGRRDRHSVTQHYMQQVWPGVLNALCQALPGCCAFPFQMPLCCDSLTGTVYAGQDIKHKGSELSDESGSINTWMPYIQHEAGAAGGSLLLLRALLSSSSRAPVDHPAQVDKLHVTDQMDTSPKCQTAAIRLSQCLQ